MTLTAVAFTGPARPIHSQGGPGNGPLLVIDLDHLWDVASR
jgi:hypothetical protein